MNATQKTMKILAIQLLAVSLGLSFSLAASARVVCTTDPATGVPTCVDKSIVSPPTGSSNVYDQVTAAQQSYMGFIQDLSPNPIAEVQAAAGQASASGQQVSMQKGCGDRQKQQAKNVISDEAARQKAISDAQKADPIDALSCLDKYKNFNFGSMIGIPALPSLSDLFKQACQMVDSQFIAPNIPNIQQQVNLPGGITIGGGTQFGGSSATKVNVTPPPNLSSIVSGSIFKNP